jgi:NIPSNAP
MPYLIDTIEVEPRSLAHYLDVVHQLGVPVMTDAGATFVSCATTAADFGENVDIQIVWAFSDHAQWNVIRRNMVLDPRWYEYAGRVATLRKAGTRRFYYPVSFSPAPFSPS